MADCPNVETSKYESFNHCQERGLDDDTYEAHTGNFVGMFRQPEQRLISDCYQQVRTHMKHESNVSNAIYSTKLFRQRCQTRMLTDSRTQNHCGNFPFNVQPSTLTTAIQRLREGFWFVGLTEQWNLSVCMFNIMLNSPCRPEHFEKTHPSGAREPYNTSIINGVLDRYDTLLYGVAEQLFNESFRASPFIMINKHSCQSFLS